MVPGFRKVLRFAGAPVDASEAERRKYGRRLILIVTACLLPLLFAGAPLWVFVRAQVVWGAGMYVNFCVKNDHAVVFPWIRGLQRSDSRLSTGLGDLLCGQVKAIYLRG